MTPTTCTNTHCDRQVTSRNGTAHGLCTRCYQRQRRGLPLDALDVHAVSPAGEATQITLRITKELAERMERAARALGVAPTVAWRRAGLKYLELLNIRSKER